MPAHKARIKLMAVGNGLKGKRLSGYIENGSGALTSMGHHLENRFQ
jgi:hypothetical protein